MLENFKFGCNNFLFSSRSYFNNVFQFSLEKIRAQQKPRNFYIFALPLHVSEQLDSRRGFKVCHTLALTIST